MKKKVGFSLVGIFISVFVASYLVHHVFDYFEFWVLRSTILGVGAMAWLYLSKLGKG
jgi:hypothetical protein